MKSLCIKTNNNEIIEYLLKNISNINTQNIFYSAKCFKNYKNIIIHYLGDDLTLFYNNLSDIITNCIINFYEEKYLEHIINYNYFYFNFYEKKQIKNDAMQSLNDTKNNDYYYKKETIWISVYKYLLEHKSLILSGFVNFRLYDYKNTLDDLIAISVNKFILEKEYREFIELLRLYVNSKEPYSNQVHLIFMNDNSILLDEHKNIINTSNNIFNAKYLSDISFSSNDYILNTLLDILPKKIYIHLINKEDDFIKTLKEIFDKKIFICTDCNICQTYKLISADFKFLPS